MMACCDHTYEKYLNEDESVNTEALTKLLVADGLTPEAVRCVLAGTDRLCKCGCHVIGSEVIH